MSLNAGEVDKQIDHMIKFIEQEAAEKVEEIETKAEEEFNSEKGRLVHQQRAKIIDFYDKKEKQLELMKKIQHSSLTNQSRLQVLKGREDGLSSVLEAAKQELARIATNQQQYQQLITSLLLQGLCQLLEPVVTVQCRQKDLPFVQQVVQQGSVSTEYHNLTGLKVTLTVDTTNFLSHEIAGGIQLLSRQGRLKVDNTLDSRLRLIAEQVAPSLRVVLYGRNPQRRFDN